MITINVLDFITSKQIIMDVNDSYDLNATHVFFCADDNYAFPLSVTLASILHNNDKEYFVFHLFVLNFSEINIENLKKTVKNHQVSIILYFINIDVFSTVFHIEQSKIPTCFRLFAPYLLKDVATKLIYLDADILCLNDVKKMTTLKFDECSVMAVHDVKHIQTRQCLKYNLKKGAYFNAGILYIDVIAWNDKKISQQLALILQRDGLKGYNFLDQDLLNIVLEGDVKYISSNYNQINVPYIKPQVTEQTLFYHFAGYEKPWYSVWQTPLYDFYIQLTPWKNTALKKLSKRNFLKDNVKRLRNWIYFIFKLAIKRATLR